MNVSLTDELENFVSAKIESGSYTSPTEVVTEALHLLEEQDQAHAANSPPSTKSWADASNPSTKASTSLPQKPAPASHRKSDQRRQSQA